MHLDRTSLAALHVAFTGASAPRGAVRAARRHVDSALATCSRSIDSEVVRLRRAGPGPVPVSPLLASVVAVALEGARLTRGAYDPTTFPRPLRRGSAGCSGSAHPPQVGRAHWQQIRLHGRHLTMPRDTTLVVLDVALAMAAEQAAAEIAVRFGRGTLVMVGRHAAVAHTTHEWALPGGLLSPGHARSWAGPDDVPDPRAAAHPLPPWCRSVVTARSAALAAMCADASMVWGGMAPELLSRLAVHAELEACDGVLTHVA